MITIDVLYARLCYIVLDVECLQRCQMTYELIDIVACFRRDWSGGRQSGRSGQEVRQTVRQQESDQQYDDRRHKGMASEGVGTQSLTRYAFTGFALKSICIWIEAKCLWFYSSLNLTTHSISPLNWVLSDKYLSYESICLIFTELLIVSECDDCEVWDRSQHPISDERWQPIDGYSLETIIK